ncbi:MAG: class I SAM-dependent methyltransferase [Chthonomonadales bacterium]|nr:class I SAM-dependent methyltransferase [Chthonomonadales bacterium]
MNATEDWDVIWRWQWFRRALWQPHFRDPAHPEGRPARSAPIWNWVLQQREARRVLDCNCGLGLRAILLQEDGYEVVGTDPSGVAIQHACELTELREVPIAFHQCAWENLAEQFDSEFDAIINDAFAWTPTRAELRFAAHNFASVLRPGGSLIFTGADQWSAPESKETLVEHAWAAAPRFQLRSDFETEGTRVTLVVARDRSDVGVVENYLFVVRDEAGPRLETAAVCSSVQWTWQDYQHVCHEAGFSALASVKVPVGRREHVLNVATK